MLPTDRFRQHPRRIYSGETQQRAQRRRNREPGFDFSQLVMGALTIQQANTPGCDYSFVESRQMCCITERERCVLKSLWRLRSQNHRQRFLATHKICLYASCACFCLYGRERGLTFHEIIQIMAIVVKLMRYSKQSAQLSKLRAEIIIGART